MTLPVKGSMLVQTGPNKFESYTVQFNPTELTFDKQAQLAEIAIPGLDAPLQQFIRGNAEKLTLELFCDTSDQGIGLGAKSVTKETDRFYQLVKIVPTLHAPPVVTFYWHYEFPGNRVGAQLGQPSPNELHRRRGKRAPALHDVQPRRRAATRDGNVSATRMASIEWQLDELNLSSPDRTHRHRLAVGETLPRSPRATTSAPPSGAASPMRTRSKIRAASCPVAF